MKFNDIKMTSRSYTKSYNRKVASVTPSSIQFDKLFRENSNRPSAAKSAGTVGKWGITSFTSIRSTNINGRKEDIHKIFGSKRIKLDYGNQNAQVNSEKDPFTFDNEFETRTTTSPSIKPKKFFKSRNVLPATDEAKHEPVVVDRQLSDSQFVPGRSRAPKQNPRVISKPSYQKISTQAPIKKGNECVDNNTSDVSSRDDGKPPIVLRICKGTAMLVGGDQEVQESESDVYKITQTVSPTKVEIEHKDVCSEMPSKTETKSRVNSHSPVVTTVSMPLNDEEIPTRRTTRSRAKNLQIDLNPPPAPTPTVPTPNPSGLSLTLRKSITDSNNTLISHYDIVKTDCSTYQSKATVEPLIGRSNQPLPTTTQELIDILSNDTDSKARQESNVEKSPAMECEPQDCPMELPVDDLKPEPVNQCPEYESSSEVLMTNESNALKTVKSEENIDAERPVVKTLVDQDWFSGSEDSEAASGNAETELQTNISSPTSIEQSTSIPPVKPIAKKGSIFKSRSTGTTNGNKRRAVYKHKWCDNDKESNTLESMPSNSSISNMASGSHDNTSPVTCNELENLKLTRVLSYPEHDADFSNDADTVTTSVRCGKNVKGFYTVVKNVKKAHQIQESGEFQEFNDDVEYILDTLRENNPNATRCLSAIRLASKCMAPAFRMHVRAHGTVAKFFKALHDATKDQSLGLCTATVMFVLSQDRLAMDLDRDCLELMLSLLESDASHKDALDDCGLSRAELLKNKEKVRQLCADIQAQGHAKHLNLDNITVGQLAMETLLSLTSKRAGEWFKEELRELGGLEHIVKTITDCYRYIEANDSTRTEWSEPLLDKLRKVDRCLRVLENVTHMNEENQIYLLNYQDGILVNTMAKLYDLCGREIPNHPTMDISDKTSTGAVIRECIFAVLKVLINLTHRFNRQSFGSKTVGSQNNLINCSLNLILHVPASLPEEKRFDMIMLTLILLINLVEQCDDNKKLLIESSASSCQDNFFNPQEGGVEALIDLFYKQEEMARGEEQKTDAILDGKKDTEQPETVASSAKTQEEFIEETVAKLLQKAGRHMEHTLIGAYVVLLLGYLIMDNKEYELRVRNKLAGNNFATMVAVLQKFYNFMNLTASNEASSCGIAATDKVIKFLKLSDAKIEEEKHALPLPALDDSSIMLDLSS
ncbi:protein wings apart-like [Chelonus insularis]|uniref:protein wings apart-like n=1 Tax=Chelonus insularis TaxID=460826 RepID=UPI001588BF84|nr:protein wings apart-like [Chelonus insularis]